MADSSSVIFTYCHSYLFCLELTKSKPKVNVRGYTFSVMMVGPSALDPSCEWQHLHRSTDDKHKIYIINKYRQDECSVLQL